MSKTKNTNTMEDLLVEMFNNFTSMRIKYNNVQETLTKEEDSDAITALEAMDAALQILEDKYIKNATDVF